MPFAPVHPYINRLNLSFNYRPSITTMSQFQPNAAPGRSFISKINLKFSNLSLLKVLSSYSDKDGSTDDDTLIHNAFVRFFDERGEPYPEWLGVSVPARSAARQARTAAGNYSTFQPTSGSQATSALAQYQPVRASYNSSNSASTYQPQQTHSRQNSNADSADDERGYTRRSNSRLQEMYNKSRQQGIPGAGYNAQQAQPSTSRQNLTASLRLRDRIMNGSPTQGGRYDSPPSGSRASWGRNQ